MQFESDEAGLGMLQKNLNAESLRVRWETKTKYGPKMQVYNKAFVLGRNDFKKWALGVGPGRGISHNALQVSNPIAMYYLGDIFMTKTGAASLSGGSIAELPVTSLNEFMVEIGFLGVICFYLPYFYLLFRIRRFYQKGWYTPWQQVAAGVLFPFTLLVLMVSVLMQVFHNEVFYSILWVLAALVWDPDPILMSGSVSELDEKGFDALASLPSGLEST